MEGLNPNQRGMPASTKEGALEEKIQLAEGGAGFSQQKRLTLRARLRLYDPAEEYYSLNN